MKLAFVTNFCPHYRVKTFESLSRQFDIDFFFYSTGDEWYWQQELGVRQGTFRHRYLPGIQAGNTRVTPSLISYLYRGNYDAIIKCINGRFALPMTYFAAKMKGIPFILWSGVWMRIDTPIHRALFPVTRHIYQHSDAIVVYGSHVKEYLLTEGVAKKLIFIAAHAIDNELYSRSIPNDQQLQLKKHLCIEDYQQIVLYVGRLEEGKGLTYLLDAFGKTANNSILILVGSGTQRHILEQRTSQKGLRERVRFVGQVSPEEVIPFHSIASILVLPSVTTRKLKEPWGLVVNEAFNQGVPVIATDAVGAAAGGLVQNAKNGLIIPERDSDALAQAINHLLSDTAFRTRLSQNAKLSIQSWDNEAMVSGFRDAVRYVTSS